MIVTVFRSRLMPDAREEYVALVDRMVEIGRDHSWLHLAQRLFRRRR